MTETATMSSATQSKYDQEQPLILQLLNSDTLDADWMQQLWDSAARSGTTIEETLIRSDLIDELQVARAYSAHYLVPLFEPPADLPPPVQVGVADLLPRSLCEEYLIAPLNDEESTLEVAVFSPDSLMLADEIKLRTGRQMRPLFAPLSVITRLIGCLYDGQPRKEPSRLSLPTGQRSHATGNSTVQASPDAKHAIRKNGTLSMRTDTAGATKVGATRQRPIDSKDAGRESLSSAKIEKNSPRVGEDDQRAERQATQFVNGLIEQALQSGVSEIHIEPFARQYRIRQKVSGQFIEVESPSQALMRNVCTRIKRLSKVSRQQTAGPRRGKIAVRTATQTLAIRVNACPTLFGDKLVLKVLDRDASPETLDQIGTRISHRQMLRSTLSGGRGLVLFCGPRDSGITTSMYACLREISVQDYNICAVESLVDFPHDGITQVQTDSSGTATKTDVIDSFIQQSADAILVDEITDSRTAELCCRAATTGHLVVSSVHASSALDGLARMRQLGVDAYQLAQSLELLVSQRLLRRLCDRCKTEHSLRKSECERLGMSNENTVFEPAGCDRCGGTGFSGRVAIFETIPISDALRKCIVDGDPLSVMNGLVTRREIERLRDHAAEQIVGGLVSARQSLAVLPDC